jgi:peptidoglycan-N-acetylglucosamine deacetylase
MRKLFTTFIMLFCMHASFASTKEIAITIDDLPLVGSGSLTPSQIKRTHERFMRILQTLTEHQVPATGFIIASHISKDQWELLTAFRNAGFSLGNHTYSHQSLDSISADHYIEDVAKADRILSPVMTEPKFFRYPYLAEAHGEKKKQVQAFLNSLHYRIAPVTIDSKDYKFNEQLYHMPYRARAAHLPALIKRYVAYIWEQTLQAEKRTANSTDKPVKQILLIHANLLNSYALGAIIELYKSKGYTFVPLIDAAPLVVNPILSLHQMVIQQLVFYRG